MKKFIKNLKSQRGMTLVETVVSLALLSLLALFVAVIFAFSVTIVGNHGNIKKNNADAAAGIEKEINGYTIDEDVVIDTTDGNYEINFNGQIITQNGTYYKSVDQDNKGDGYYYFVPNP